MSDAIRAAFIGAGGNARGHMKQFKAVEGAEIIGICDVDESRAGEATQQFGGKAYTDYRKMLDETKPDVAYISVPPFAHGDPERAVIERGHHFLVEKPVALQVELAMEICEAAEKANLITCVGYQLRYWETAGIIRDYVADKTIGMLHGRYWGGLPGTAWWRKMELSGGQLVEQSTHCLDMMRFFAGDVKQVFSGQALRTMQTEEGLDVPDCSVLYMEFANGAIGDLTSTCMLNKGGGSAGSDIDIILRDRRITWNAAAMMVAPEDPAMPNPTGQTPSTIDSMFVAAVRNKDQSLLRSSYRDGMKSFAVSLAASESAKTGKVVEVRV